MNLKAKHIMMRLLLLEVSMLSVQCAQAFNLGLTVPACDNICLCLDYWVISSQVEILMLDQSQSQDTMIER